MKIMPNITGMNSNAVGFVFIAKAKAIDEIKSVSVDLAIQAASKVIDKNLYDSANRDLANSTINEAN